MVLANDEWRTPEWVYKPYGPFDLDAAATAENTLAPKFITKEDNAFYKTWDHYVPRGSKIWCNPPYSKQGGPLNAWITVFLMERNLNGMHIIACLPSDTSTKWFHYLYYEMNSFHRKIHFLKPRVRFIDPATGKPGGSPKFGTIIVEFIP